MMQTNELKEFWQELQNKIIIQIEDLDKLKELLMKALIKMEDLELSRDNWKKKFDELKKKIEEETEECQIN